MGLKKAGGDWWEESSSPDGAQRNPGHYFNHIPRITASGLHPGYKLRLYG
jgi:hypothetical protein